MASSSIRYGDGVTKEVGWDVINLGIKNLVVVTDKNVGHCWQLLCLWPCVEIRTENQSGLTHKKDLDMKLP